MPIKMLHIPTADGQADALAAFPDRGERHPGVLMYADGFGIRPVLREMARELPGLGYYVLVPNLFYRHGPAPVIELPEHIGEEVRPAVIAQLMPLIEAHTAERVLSDANAYLRFLTTQPEVGAGPVAVTGYCIGGLLAMRTAAAHPWPGGRRRWRYRRISRREDRTKTRFQYRPEMVLIEDMVTAEQFDVTRDEDEAFWAWAIIETLRHTGVRLEELLEITHLALVSYQLPDTGEIVPLLQIIPSKGPISPLVSDLFRRTAQSSRDDWAVRRYRGNINHHVTIGGSSWQRAPSAANSCPPGAAPVPASTAPAPARPRRTAPGSSSTPGTVPQRQTNRRCSGSTRVRAVSLSPTIWHPPPAGSLAL